MQRKYFGTTTDGIPVHIFDLESASGVGVRVMEYGASLVSIDTPDRHGRPSPIILGFDALSGYLGHGSETDSRGEIAHGATLSRYVGLHQAVWWGEALNEGVRFHYRSPAGGEGTPGAVDCSVE